MVPAICIHIDVCICPYMFCQCVHMKWIGTDGISFYKWDQVQDSFYHCIRKISFTIFELF